jgi:hypothetical protein
VCGQPPHFLTDAVGRVIIFVLGARSEAWQGGGAWYEEKRGYADGFFPAGALRRRSEEVGQAIEVRSRRAIGSPELFVCEARLQERGDGSSAGS